MGKYINPFTDWGFKRLFGQEPSKELLISFLNDLLAGEMTVQSVVFMDNEQLPATRDQRGIVYDVYCKSDTGERFIVEMQNKWQPNFIDRSICYASRCILKQVDKGKTEKQDAYKFLPVYTVCFMNYMPKADELGKFRTDIVLADKDDMKLASDKLRFIYLALPLFKKKAEECENDFEKWIYVLKHMEALSRMPFTAQKEIFRKLEEYADSHRLTRKEWEAYENSLWIARDNMACMAAAEQEAREKGLAEGIVKGRAEEKMDVARRFLAMGLSPEQVATGAGISIEDAIQMATDN